MSRWRSAKARSTTSSGTPACVNNSLSPKRSSSRSQPGTPAGGNAHQAHLHFQIEAGRGNYQDPTAFLASAGAVVASVPAGPDDTPSGGPNVPLLIGLGVAAIALAFVLD